MHKATPPAPLVRADVGLCCTAAGCWCNPSAHPPRSCRTAVCLHANTAFLGRSGISRSGVHAPIISGRSSRSVRSISRLTAFHFQSSSVTFVCGRQIAGTQTAGCITHSPDSYSPSFICRVSSSVHQPMRHQQDRLTGSISLLREKERRRQKPRPRWCCGEVIK